MPRKSGRKPTTRARARANAKAIAMQSVVVNVGAKPAPRRRRQPRRAPPSGRPPMEPQRLPPLMINSQAHTMGQPFQPIAAMAVPALAPMPRPAPVSDIGHSAQYRGAELVHTSVSDIARNEQFREVRPPASPAPRRGFADPETGFERWGKAEELSPPMRTLPKNLAEEMEQLQLDAPAVASSSSAAAATAAVAAPGERPGGLSSTDRDRRDRPLAIQRYPDMTIKEALKQYRADERAAKAGPAQAAP